MTLTAERTARVAEPVRLSALTKELGIEQYTRRLMIEQGLVTPLAPVRRGSPTYVDAKDAEDVRQAWMTALKIGISVIIVLKVLRALDGS